MEKEYSGMNFSSPAFSYAFLSIAEFTHMENTTDF